MFNIQDTQELDNLIRKIVKQENKKIKISPIIPAIVVSIGIGVASVKLASDYNVILNNLLNKTGEILNINDEVYLYCINDNLSNACILIKKGITVPLSTIPIQESWQVPTLLNGWIDYGDVYNPTGYWKDSFGVVHLRGLVKSGTMNQNIFVLPSGYRPQYKEIQFSNSDNAYGRVDILTDGSVLPVVGNNLWISLDGITFRAV